MDRARAEERARREAEEAAERQRIEAERKAAEEAARPAADNDAGEAAARPRASAARPAAGKPAPAAPTAQVIELSIYDDGRLAIIDGDEILVLPPDATRRLGRFLGYFEALAA